MDVSLAARCAGCWSGCCPGCCPALLTRLVYACEDVFLKLPIHWMWWPVLGGVVVGLGGLIDPRALGVGYDNIAQMLHGGMPPRRALVLLAVKAVIWAVALGSGTSGGVLAPLLIMGGGMGAALALLLPAASPGFWALLAMAATMGGTMRSPLTATFFAAELTGNTHVLLPLIAACVTAHLVTVLLMRRSILTEKVARRGHHLSREYRVDPFALTRARDVMTTAVQTLADDMTLHQAARFLDRSRDRAPELSGSGCRRPGARPCRSARGVALAPLREASTEYAAGTSRWLPTYRGPPGRVSRQHDRTDERGRTSRTFPSSRARTDG